MGEKGVRVLALAFRINGSVCEKQSQELLDSQSL